jgi:hypothetical protein
MSRCTSLATTILGTVARDLQVISSTHGEKSRLKDLMVQVPLLLTIDNSFLTVLSRQKSSFDIRCRDGLAEHGFAKVNRVEDRFRIAFPDGYERLPIVLHDMLPCQDRSLYPEARWRTVAAVTVRSRDLPSARVG